MSKHKTSKHKTLWFLTHGKFLLYASLLVALLPSAVYAHEPCTLATVSGSYAFATLGQQAGAYEATLFLMTSDGKGNLSGTGSESLSGTIESNVTATGTYTLTSGCWFTATIKDSLGNVRDLAGVVLQIGGRITGISTDEGTDLQLTAYRQHSTECTQANIGGYLESDVQSPLTPSGPSTATQQWFVNSKGSGTGSWEATVGGTIVEGTATGTFPVNSDCTFTSTETYSDGTTRHFFGVAGKLTDSASMSIQTDSGFVSLSTSYAE
jgi:hypothetical protein